MDSREERLEKAARQVCDIVEAAHRPITNMVEGIPFPDKFEAISALSALIHRTAHVYVHHSLPDYNEFSCVEILGAVVKELGKRKMALLEKMGLAEETPVEELGGVEELFKKLGWKV